MDQYRIPCVIMRAGTSKGIFLKENDLGGAGAAERGGAAAEPAAGGRPWGRR